MNLTIEEREKIKKHNIYVPYNPTEANINMIRHVIKINEFHRSDEYKKIKEIFDRHYIHIFNLPKVVSVRLDSSLYYDTSLNNNPEFYINVMIEKLSDNLPTEEGLKIKYIK